MILTTATLKLAALLAGVPLASAFPSHHRHLASQLRRRASVSNSTAPVAASWYANWHADDVPLANISWSKYTHMTYAFAVTSVTEYVSLTDDDKTLLTDFVKNAHENNVTALLSIGGWGGSTNYSTIVDSATHRTEFVKTVTGIAANYSLDGFDFDWEYPNGQGIGCNDLNPNDTANFLSFLQELRADPAGSQLFLTAAAAVTPWNDADGNPSTNLTGFSGVLDYIAIMNYDVWGSFSPTAGPNAPLNDSCVADSSQAAGSAVSAVKAWNDAGIPLNQLVLGVPAYGHSYSVQSADALPKGLSGELEPFPSFAKAKQPLGDSWDSSEVYTDVCGNPQGQEGVFDFWGLIQGGFLNENGTAQAGIARVYDECSQTPFVYNSTSKVFVSYDDAQSFAAKGAFINSTGLRGFAMWEAGGDYKDILLDSIRSAVGFPANGTDSDGSSLGGSLTPPPAEGSGDDTEDDTDDC
ncbi:glycoside hydrolase family 18 protein [Auriscalpium vulgare]|uniref:Glycoside hydrolase family 18 protein n=1 Tax=Auriscalpium vulgare TaxID=40419 RepID=A0ACB8SAY5_9AGAM|nr:glycoside hydrolase family 18 protein [Auriscalpium vulgare]